MKKAIITGITGQDGSYLTELLLSKDYEVHGLVRRASFTNLTRLKKVLGHQDLHLHYGDLCDATSINRLVGEVRPDEVYNLGAMSDVRVSFDCPEYTTEVDATGTIRLLEALRAWSPEAKFYQASSSEMFGKVVETPQSETTPFYPRSPYGCAKVFSYWATVNYREAYSIHASNGILFNHESPRRGENFVTRKITKAIANILAGRQEVLYLGNLEAKRDWGFAGDYVKAMWLMLQQETPDDYVIATGETHSVREFVELAFDYVGLNPLKHVLTDPKLFRPTEVDLLLGNPEKAKKKLGWQPMVGFEELVRMMVDADRYEWSEV